MAGVRHNHYTPEMEAPRGCPACDADLSGRFEDEVAFLLNTALLAAGMEQADLARTTGLSTKSIGQLVQGRVPMSAPVAVLIERAVDGLSAEELLYAEARKQIRALRGWVGHGNA